MVLTKNKVYINEHTVSVGLGEIAVTRDPKICLASFGLGSCICLCLHDPVSKTSGMAHIVLPESKPGTDDPSATKYADIAVPVLLERMIKEGAKLSRIVVKVVGGAKMIKSLENNDAFDMGNRNLEMVKTLLAQKNLKITGSDTGGNHGRSVWLFAENGLVMARKAGEEPQEV